MNPMFVINGLFPAYWVGQPGFDLGCIEANFAYVLDAEGWKLYKRNGVSTAVIKVDSVAGLATLPQRVNFTAHRIPLDLIRRVSAFFKAIYVKFRSEAVGYLLYRPSSGEWRFEVPTQTATGGSADYSSPPRCDGWQVVGTVHSHASMPAFHSGTDDHDEKSFDGVHITVGHLDSIPEFSCSIVIQGKREVVDPATLIDGLTPAEEVPASWLAAVKLPEPRLLEPLFQARASALYKEYFAGKISEQVYQAELGKLEAEAEAYRKAQAEREAAALARTTSFQTSFDKKGLEDKGEYNRLAEGYTISKSSKKKGGKYGK